jgi:hypothetical protein
MPAVFESTARVLWGVIPRISYFFHTCMLQMSNSKRPVMLNWEGHWQKQPQFILKYYPMMFLMRAEKN